MNLRPLHWHRAAALFLGAALACLWPEAALGYPYLDLRPGGQSLSGPTDGNLGALHFNPAAIRLYSGSQVMAVAGANGYLGSYQRSTPLPTGFSPSSTGPTTADAAPIGWASPDVMAAASWDLRTDAVTLGFGFYTPHMDFSNYAPGHEHDAATLQNLATRYHLVSAQTYTLWSTVAVGLRLRPWIYLGAGFNFAYTRSRSFFYRDLDPNPAQTDGFSCSGASCERWENRMAVETDVGNWGYGFSAGALFVPLPERLFIGLSYVSPLFTGRGDEVGLGGLPDRTPWQSPTSDGCVGSPLGARVTPREAGPVCGSALLSLAFPHVMYLGVRGRVGGGGGGGGTSDGEHKRSRSAPSYVELTGWIRVTVPPREGLELNLDRRAFPPGLLTLPLSLKSAVAVTLGVRQHWRRLILGEELLYESPRSDARAVSPANLEGHKLDLSLAVRLRVARRLSLVLTVGATYVFFPSDAGTGFSPSYAQQCRGVDYDISSTACQLTQAGWAVPAAPGTYQLVIPHGVSGFELNL